MDTQQIADTMRTLQADDVVLVTTRGPKRSITRRGEVKSVRDFGGTLVLLTCYQKRYVGKPWESVHTFNVQPSSVEKIEVVR